MAVQVEHLWKTFQIPHETKDDALREPGGHDEAQAV